MKVGAKHVRSLKKEKRKVFISKKLLPISVTDENGFDTGEYCNTYSEPLEICLNIKPITNIAEQQAFGVDIENVLKAVYTPFDVSKYAISEFDIAWIGLEPNGVLQDDGTMNNNYVVIKVLDTGNQLCVYFKKTVGGNK